MNENLLLLAETGWARSVGGVAALETAVADTQAYVRAELGDTPKSRTARIQALRAAAAGR